MNTSRFICTLQSHITLQKLLGRTKFSIAACRITVLTWNPGFFLTRCNGLPATLSKQDIRYFPASLLV